MWFASFYLISTDYERENVEYAGIVQFVFCFLRFSGGRYCGWNFNFFDVCE